MSKATNNSKIASFLGVEEFLVNPDGGFINGPLLGTMEEKIDGMNALETENQDGKQQIATLTASIEKLKEEKSALEKANASLKEQVTNLEAAAKEMGQNSESITAAHAKDLEAKDAEIEKRDAAIKTSEQNLSAKDQEIADLKTQIDALQNDPGNEPAAGPQPNKNGGGATTPTLNIGIPVYNSSLTPKENKMKFDEFMASQQKLVSGF